MGDMKMHSTIKLETLTGKSLLEDIFGDEKITLTLISSDGS
jgi:hypothetical protein